MDRKWAMKIPRHDEIVLLVKTRIGQIGTLNALTLGESLLSLSHFCRNVVFVPSAPCILPFAVATPVHPNSARQRFSHFSRAGMTSSFPFRATDSWLERVRVFPLFP